VAPSRLIRPKFELCTGRFKLACGFFGEVEVLRVIVTAAKDSDDAGFLIYKGARSPVKVRL
jgi:hypothetical protein